MSNSVWLHRRQPTRLPRPWDSPGKNTGVGCHFLLQWMKVNPARHLWNLAGGCGNLLVSQSPKKAYLSKFPCLLNLPPANLKWSAILFCLSLLSGWASQVVPVVKNPPDNAEDFRDMGFDPWVSKILWRRAWQSTPELLPGESLRPTSLVDYSP